MRQLASIQQIHSIRPIENADLIEVAGVLGWEVVVKKGEFQVNDICIYCEIDSWISHDIAPFLSKGKEPREYNGVKGERLKSCRLRGTLSQGLILPLNILSQYSIMSDRSDTKYCVGDDVTDRLGIQKYEPPVPAQMQGDARGGFNWPISKTDEERVQNNGKYGFIEALWGRPYYISLKLDGTSSTLEIVSRLGMKFVPILERGDNFQYTIEDCLRLAEGKYIQHFPSAKPGQEREGLVFRSLDSAISFKAISNRFLLKDNDE